MTMMMTMTMMMMMMMMMMLMMMMMMMMMMISPYWHGRFPQIIKASVVDSKMKAQDFLRRRK